jgi:hypothetical protein
VTYSVSGGGGGAVDLSACTQLGYPNAAYYDVAYPISGNVDIGNVFSQAVGGSGIFASGAALVVRFTTPALGANDTTQPNFQTWTGLGTNRQATLGTAPCLVPTVNSATPSDASTISPQGVIKTTLTSTPTFSIVITANGLCNLGVLSCGFSSTVWLKPSTTYYITLVNKTALGPSGVNSCNQANCDMRFKFNN